MKTERRREKKEDGEEGEEREMGEKRERRRGGCRDTRGTVYLARRASTSRLRRVVLRDDGQKCDRAPRINCHQKRASSRNCGQRCGVPKNKLTLERQLTVSDFSHGPNIANQEEKRKKGSPIKFTHGFTLWATESE